MRDGDVIFSALRQEANERDLSLHPRWEALARGELSPDEERAIVEESKQSPEVAALYEAFRPLGSAAEDRYVARVLATSSTPKPARRPAWRSSAIGGALAMAAAAIVYMAMPRAHDLPAYSIAVTGGEQTMRGEPRAGTPILGPGSRLSIVLRPDTKLEGKVEAHAFLMRDGAARAWPAPMKTSNEGAVLIEGTREQLFPSVPAGRWEIVIALSRPGDAPNAGDFLSKKGLRLLRTEVVLRDTLVE